MKKFLFTLLLFVLSNFIKAQTRYQFAYDVAGNQTAEGRRLMINSRSELTYEPIKFKPEDNFKYYPNPVKEELYLTWENHELNKITELYVYNINGLLIKKVSDLINKEETSVSFYDLPIGVYLVNIVYENRDVKTIKIIKN